jgi:hypothetical protein
MILVSLNNNLEKEDAKSAVGDGDEEEHPLNVQEVMERERASRREREIKEEVCSEK